MKSAEIYRFLNLMLSKFVNKIKILILIKSYTALFTYSKKYTKNFFEVLITYIIRVIMVL